MKSGREAQIVDATGQNFREKVAELCNNVHLFSVISGDDLLNFSPAINRTKFKTRKKRLQNPETFLKSRYHTIDIELYKQIRDV